MKHDPIAPLTEPLVLLPGLMCDARLFLPQIAALSCRRPIHVATLGPGETIEEMAAALLTRAPDRFALAGHSLGGAVALEVVRKAPERVTRLALMCTSALGRTPAEAIAREPRIVAARAGRFEEMLREELTPDDLAPGAAHIDVLHAWLDMGRALGPEIYVSQCRALQRRPDQQAVLRRIRVPTLILCGEHDGIFPVARHDFMAALIPTATLAVIPGTGHLPTLERPAAVIDAMWEWLSGVLVLR